MARQIFLRLITLGEGVEDTRRRAPRSELAGLVFEQRQRMVADDAAVSSASATRILSVFDKVIDAFGRARLLTFDRDPITREPTVEWIGFLCA